MNDYTTIAARLAEIHREINAACLKAGRDIDSVKLVAVSKKQPVEKMLDYQRLSAERKQVPIFGENYVQEFKKKKLSLLPEYKSHLIGHLQSNKVRDAVNLFDVIESVHSIEILNLIDKEARRKNKVQQVLLQVNISDDSDKHGFSREAAAQFLSGDLAAYAGIEICGLMTITRLYDDPQAARPDFKAMSELGRSCRKLLEKSRPVSIWDISMGMSADYQIAIEEGATLVRIGTALFGER